MTGERKERPGSSGTGSRMQIARLR